MGAGVVAGAIDAGRAGAASVGVGMEMSGREGPTTTGGVNVIWASWTETGMKGGDRTLGLESGGTPCPALSRSLPPGVRLSVALAGGLRCVCVVTVGCLSGPGVPAYTLIQRMADSLCGPAVGRAIGPLQPDLNAGAP